METDPYCIAQGALLLSHQYSLTDQHVNNVWLGGAIEYSKACNADHYDDPNAEIMENSRRKRLWWSCVIRDRILALGVRQPIFITPEKFDFDQEGLVPADLESELKTTIVYPPGYKSTPIFWAIEICHLAKLMTPALMVVEKVKSLQMIEQYKKPLNLCRTLQLLRQVHAKLDEWESSLSKADSKFPEGPSSGHSQVVMMHKNLIYIYW